MDLRVGYMISKQPVIPVFALTESRAFWPAAVKPDGSAGPLEELASVAEGSQGPL